MLRSIVAAKEKKMDSVESLLPLAFWIIVGALVVSALSLLVPLMNPTIIEYPWQFPSSDRQQQSDKKKVVLLAGSYNPPHNGHLAMLEYLSKRYGQVIAVVGMNPNKKYLVSPEERVELIRSMLRSNENLNNVNAQAVSGYIWRFAKEERALIFFRGIRSWEKDGKEERALQILNTWGPLLLGRIWPIPTVYLSGKPEYNHISSTLIRDVCRGGDCEPLSSLVPASITTEITNLYSRKEK